MIDDFLHSSFAYCCLWLVKPLLSFWCLYCSSYISNERLFAARSLLKMERLLGNSFESELAFVRTCAWKRNKFIGLNLAFNSVPFLTDLANSRSKNESMRRFLRRFIFGCPMGRLTLNCATHCGNETKHWIGNAKKEKRLNIFRSH